MKFRIENGVMGYDKKPILTDVNIEIDTGSILCVLGKNGAGKTTFFKSLLGMLPLISGNIFLDDIDVSNWNRRKFSSIISYVPQVHSFSFSFTVMEVVLLGRSVHINMFGSPTKKDKDIAEEALKQMKIWHMKDRQFNSLSGGEQKLVIVARALAQQASFIVMDEPTSSLDFGNQIKIIKQVRDLQDKSLGIIMSTHSPDHAFMCDAQALIVDSNKIVNIGDCSNVTESLLKRIYGVDILIDEFSRSYHKRKVCVPTI